MEKIKQPKISICKKRIGFKIACFDEFDCIRDFIFYICEKDGVDDAEKFFESKGIKKEDIKTVRPVIKKITMR